jgi:hypothetical protein
MLRPILQFTCLWLLSAVAGSAHDLMNSSTDIWLRPDSMQVDLVLASATAATFLNVAPTVHITDDNFAEIYQPLFEKVAPSLLSLTLDGQPLSPILTEVAPSQETDIKFTYIFTRPAGGRLGVNAPFMKKMGGDFLNSIGLNEASKVLGFDDQRVGDPPWEISIDASPAAPPAATSAMTAEKPAAAPATGTPITDLLHPDVKLTLWGYLLIALAVFAIILFPEYQRRRQIRLAAKSKPGWPER